MYNSLLYQNEQYRNHRNSNVSNETEERIITVNGEGKVKVYPDTANVTFGVITEDEKLSVAQEENAKITSNVINALNNVGISSEDIETTTYFINPKYDYVDGKQIFRGYEVINKFTVTINDISNVGKIIDTAVEAGANSVSNLQFKVSDTSKEYRKALQLAVIDAFKKAQAIGKTLNVKINQTPNNVTELGNQPVPIAPSTARSFEASTPIEPGVIEISAFVRSEYSY